MWTKMWAKVFRFILNVPDVSAREQMDATWLEGYRPAAMPERANKTFEEGVDRSPKGVSGLKKV